MLVTEPDGQVNWPSKHGLYFRDTRVISAWAIYANGESWDLLNGGARESEQDWPDLLIDLKRRGLDVPPRLTIADGALGFWKVAGEVWPKNARAALPKSADFDEVARV